MGAPCAVKVLRSRHHHCSCSISLTSLHHSLAAASSSVVTSSRSFLTAPLIMLLLSFFTIRRRRRRLHHCSCSISPFLFAGSSSVSPGQSGQCRYLDDFQDQAAARGSCPPRYLQPHRVVKTAVTCYKR